LQRAHFASIRKEKLIDIIKQKCIESRELFSLKRRFTDQNYEINKDQKKQIEIEQKNLKMNH